MPRKEEVIGASVYDVPMSGSMTGSHVGASPLSLLTDEGSPSYFLGHDIGEEFFCLLFYKEK